MFLVADPASGINKIALIERLRSSGRIAVALISGLGLREGAMASSVAHDSHNIIVAGVEGEAMALPVIPALKITDHGLFDVEKFSFL